MEAVAPSLKAVPESDRKAIYEALIEWAEQEDWDTQNEAEGIDPVLDGLLREKGYLIDDED